MRLNSFRNLIAGSPIGFLLFCKANFLGYMPAILNPISSWTNVSIAYNRYAMCRFDLETYRRKFSRSRTFRWVRFTWMVPIIYGAIVIALMHRNFDVQDKEKTGRPLDAGSEVSTLYSTQSPLVPSLSAMDNFNLTAQINSKINASTLRTNNQTFPTPLSLSHLIPPQNSDDQKFEFSEDAGISDYHSKHVEHPMVSQTLPGQPVSPLHGRWFDRQNTSQSGNSSGSVNRSMAVVVNKDDRQEKCTFGQSPNLNGTVALIGVMAFTFVSNIIPNLYALYAMFYVLRTVHAVDNATLVSWTKGTVIFLGIRALLCLPVEIMILLRLPVFGIAIPHFPFYLLRDLKVLLMTADPFIFGLRLPDFKAFLLRQNHGQ